jgi:hypothetical protein
MGSAFKKVDEMALEFRSGSAGFKKENQVSADSS